MLSISYGRILYIGLPILAVMLLLGYCVSPLATARFRMTIEIETPTGVKKASNVYDYQVYSRSYPGGGIAYLQGDAVFVDLGQGKHIIAIMGHGPRAEYVDLFSQAWAISYKPVVDGRRVDTSAMPTMNQGPRDLTDDLIPTLVTFDDIRDPKTARVVYAWGRKIEMSASGAVPHDRGPELKINDIAKALGGGYAFKRALVEIVPKGIWPLSALGLSFNLLGLTGTPVTRGIEKRFSWFGDRVVLMPPRWLELTETQRSIVVALQQPFKLKN